MKESKIVVDVDGNESKEYCEVQSKIPTIEIHILNVILPLVDSIIQKSKTMKIWICPKCKNENFARDTPINSTEWSSNATFGVIWDQPIWTFTTRNQFDKSSMYWVTIFLQEIEMGLMAYQQAYFDEHHSEMKETIPPFTHDMNSNDEVSN